MGKVFEVEVSKVAINGIWYFTVRVTDGGELAIKRHFNTIGETREIAEAEATRLGVTVRNIDEKGFAS